MEDIPRNNKNGTDNSFFCKATLKISGMQRYESSSMGSTAYFNASLCQKIGMSVFVQFLFILKRKTEIKSVFFYSEVKPFLRSDSSY